MKKNKKHYLITGGLGFIGSAIANNLIKKRFKVTIYDDLSRGKKKRVFKKFNNLKFINGDIRDSKKFNKSLKGVDVVIHLAYINGTKFFYSRPTEVLDVAIKGIMNTIDGCKENGIKELYLASSSEVYQTPSKVPTDEKELLKIPDVYNPRYSYGAGKILTEIMGINFGKKYFKKLIIFRPHNVYGPKMGNEHVIPEFVNRFKSLKGKKFKIQGNGSETRSFIYIDDFVEAFQCILKRGKHLNIYNIGTSEKVTIKQLVKKLSKIFKKKISIKKSQLAKGSTKKRLPNIKKIKLLGFKQKIKLEEGLKLLVIKK